MSFRRLLFLLIALIAATLLGCGGSNPAATNTASNTQPAATTPAAPTNSTPGGGTSTPSPAPTPSPTSAPAPTIHFSASPASITSGQNSVLSWNTTDATSVSLQPGSSNLSASAAVTVTPSATTTYTVTATGAGGTISATVTVTVTSAPPPPAPAPSLQFSANPASITAGQSSLLSWSTSNATSVSLQPGSSNLAASGSVTVMPTATTTYTATATGAGGTTRGTATVTVAAAPPTPAPSFRFLALGDSRDDPALLATLSLQAVALNPVFAVYTGDAESNGFTISGADAFIAAFNGYTGDGLSAKTFLIRGNHDAGDTAGWQAYYNFPAVAGAVGAKNFTALDADLTYSFDYQNAHFVAVDVPGEVDLITSAQMAWIDSDLAGAESRGLTHAFLYWHGPIYCVESQHCQFAGQLGSYAPQPLVDVINKHAIVSAMFFGHEHVLAHTHMDGTRLSGLTRPFEEVVVGTAGAPLYGCDMPLRSNWCSAVPGYTSIDVAGPAVTINYYQQGSTSPIKTVTYTK